MTHIWDEWFKPFKRGTEPRTLPAQGNTRASQDRLRELEVENTRLAIALQRSDELLRDKTRQLERINIEAIRTEGKIEILTLFIGLIEDVKRATWDPPKMVLETPWFSGMIATLRKLTVALARSGLSTYGKEHERFNPALHHAIQVEYRSDIHEDTIVAVFTPGYRFQGVLIQPAQVRVAVQETRITA